VASRPPGTLAASTDEWTVKVQVRQGSYVEENFLGVRQEAQPGPDRFDFRNPPAAPGGLDLAFRLPEGDARQLYRTDYRPLQAEGAAWDVTLSPGTGRTLLFAALEPLPAGRGLLLLTDRGHQIPIAFGAPVELPDDVGRLSLLAGSPSYLEQGAQSLLPRLVTLYPNFPNPFNPRTAIRFALPSESHLALEIFDVLGRRVRVLADGTLPAGTHDLIWDGTDNSGRRLGSGVYLYRLSSGIQSYSGKMLLLR
jgi:hypothetical protein